MAKKKESGIGLSGAIILGLLAWMLYQMNGAGEALSFDGPASSPKCSGAVHGRDQKAITAAQKYARAVSRQKFGTDRYYEDLVSLWSHESEWKWWNRNKHSGAYGIPQALPASKMASAGSDWRTNACTQIRWGADYILDRYKNPSQAWVFWQCQSNCRPKRGAKLAKTGARGDPIGNWY
jgi:hypothetical protein